MYLSNRLTFSLLFSVFLIAALIVAPIAMAQVTVTAYKIDTAGTADDKAKTVITFTYSEAPSPRPVLGDFTVDDGVTGVVEDPDTPDEPDVLTSPYTPTGGTEHTAVVGGSGTTVTLTLETVANSDTVPTVLAGLALKGYTDGVLDTLQDQTANDPPQQTDLVLLDGYIGGKTYVVYVRGTSATVAATDPIPNAHLPVNIEVDTTITPARPSVSSQALRTIFPGADGNSNMAMPDLEDFFWVGGGTIDLNVADTAANSRHLIINEVMWALDDRLVGQDGHTSQQWIEVYNRLSTPAPAPSFMFTNNTGGLNPPADVAAGTSDRLSNIPSYVTTWNVKGSNGSSTLNTAGDTIIGANPVFRSMYRKTDKQNADGTNAGHWEASDRPYLAGFYGTPGKVNTRGVVTGGNPAPSTANPAMSHVLINEVYNAVGDDKNDWLELRALQNTNLNLWTLSYVNAGTNEVEILPTSQQDYKRR